MESSSSSSSSLSLVTSSKSNNNSDTKINMTVANLLEEAKRKLSEIFDYKVDLPHLPPDLESLQIQSFTHMKELLILVEKDFVIDQLCKPTTQWTTLQESESVMEESDKILHDVTSVLKNKKLKIERQVSSVIEALSHLKEDVNTLRDKIFTLESLREQYPTNKVSIEKMSVPLAAAQQACAILQKRVKTKEDILQQLQEEWLLLEAKNTGNLQELNGLEDSASFRETCLGLHLTMVDPHTIQLKFDDKGDRNINTDNLAQTESSPDDHLVATIRFNEEDDKSLVLSDVKLNKKLEGSETIIMNAKTTSDLPAFVRELTCLWTTNVPLLLEISQLRQRHAIDWIPEERKLCFMVGKSIVVTLCVPPTYPHADNVYLEQVTGGPTNICTENIKEPSKKTLTDWVVHLKDLFGRP